MKCCYCNSKNLYSHSNKPGRKRWKCNNCNRTFMKSTLKGYPPTKYPFEFIGFVLYFNANYKSLKKTVTFANELLSRIDIKKKIIPRQTVFSWIKNYGNNLKQHITLKESLRFFNEHKIFKSYKTKDKDLNEYKRYERDSSIYYKKIIKRYNDKINKAEPAKLIYPGFPYKEPKSQNEFLQFLIDELGKKTAIALINPKISKKSLREILKKY